MWLTSRVLSPVLLAVGLFLAAASAVISADSAIPQRADIADQYKWRVADIFPTDSAWEAAFAGLQGSIGLFDQYRGRLGEGPATLLACLATRDSIELIADNLYVYAYLILDEDNRVSTYQEMGGRIRQLWSRISEGTSFIEPEIIAAGKDKIVGFAGQDPKLAVYRHYLDDLFRKQAHVLSDKEEALLALAGPAVSASGEIFNMVDNADIDYGTVADENGAEVALTKERVYKMLESTDRELRRRVSDRYNAAYLDYENTLAATLAASVKSDYFQAQARGYATCLESSLDRYNIPVAVFHSLIAAVNENLAPLHKWASLRKRILGVDTLFTFDLSVPLMPEGRKEYTYEQAQEILRRGLQPLGPQFLTDLEKGFTSGWIDVYETEGKGSGAYSWGTYSSHPYVLLNYNGTLASVFTLAHEMGHAMHSYYTNRHEPYISHNHSLFAAEVASTGNEAVLMKYLLDNTTDRGDKMELLNYYIEQIIGSFFTQVMFSEFELTIHERIESGQALSAEFMRKTYRDIYQKYWGPDLTIGAVNDLGCLRIGHFYSQYYVYQYATSYAAAQAMSQKVLEDPKYLDTYMQFLAVGNSDYPVEILKKAGVDLTSPEPVQRTMKLFADLVDQMEALLAESGK
ncbi:MAG TPA: oligoendopeptidase F [candidate division Zixibacteria bacterium]|nr:oligoendopeptidase F [candidate division Zixibacteria bacterium]MDM7971919.1 oligoendopeptidase F [candidate division Zixibacteria bacterium]HOD66247.1 oligoendopeptidase F [candidate division Zixibacteria bacterium]HOZ06697.1 oligoendopeptidase F [candidate division Zixibacteria bacterium]HPC10518.1 oligoendopeptidase F [candidate division Zixibacteria bacterium]